MSNLEIVLIIYVLISPVWILLNCIIFKFRGVSVWKYFREEFLVKDNQLAIRLGITVNGDMSVSTTVAHAHLFPGVKPKKRAVIMKKIINKFFGLFEDVDDHVLEAFEPFEANFNPPFALFDIVDEGVYYKATFDLLDAKRLNRG